MLKCSTELKREMVSAALKRNSLFAKWIEIVNSVVFVIILLISLICLVKNSTPIFNFISDDVIQILSLVSIILSVVFTYIFKSSEYKNNSQRLCDLKKLEDSDFEKQFLIFIDLITEIDVARARYDRYFELKAQGNHLEQRADDRIRPVDMLTMMRQRLILIVLSMEAFLSVALVYFIVMSKLYTLAIMGVILFMIVVAIVAMLYDSRYMSRNEVKLVEMYKD